MTTSTTRQNTSAADTATGCEPVERHGAAACDHTQQRGVSRRRTWASVRGDSPAWASVVWPSNGGRTSVQVAGEICTVSAERLGSLLDDVARASTTDVTIDLSRITFLDARGITLLVRIRAELAERGLDCMIVRPSRCADRVLDLVGIEQGCSDGNGPCRTCHKAASCEW